MAYTEKESCGNNYLKMINILKKCEKDLPLQTIAK